MCNLFLCASSAAARSVCATSYNQQPVCVPCEFLLCVKPWVKQMRLCTTSIFFCKVDVRISVRGRLREAYDSSSGSSSSREHVKFNVCQIYISFLKVLFNEILIIC